jgi:class 3 adenylate cyclase
LVERRIEATSETAGRAVEIVERLLGDAARQGVRGVAWARLGLAGAVVVLWPVIQYENLATGQPRTLAVFFASLFGLLLSIGTLVRTRGGRAPPRWMIFSSITADAVVVNGFLSAFVIWPGPDQPSLVSVHGSALVYICVVTAGVRLSRRGAVFGIAINTLFFGGLLIADAVRVGDLAIVGPTEFVTVAGCLGCAGVLAVTIAARTRRLVLAAATDALMAARARQKLGAYVSVEVAERALDHDEVRLGGERQDVAVLFSDLRGFTSYSETLDPEELVRQLNAYLSVMVDVIAAEGGVVDKYIGDAIMAVFGAPAQREDDAARAIRAAAAMNEALVAHNAARARKDLPPLRQGVGVHYGPVVAGNVGTKARAAYTVIGDTVNLASRLESSTKEQGVTTLFSEAAIKAAGDEAPAVREVTELTVRGREQPVKVYTLAEA